MKRLKSPMLYLFFLFMLDFILTYYGIRIGAISERNPLWMAILDLPFYLGIAIRILHFLILIYVPMKWILKNREKCRPVLIKAFYWIAFAANIWILGVHVYWITVYHSFMI